MKSYNFVNFSTASLPLQMPPGCRAMFFPVARKGESLNPSLPTGLVLARQIHSDKIIEVNQRSKAVMTVGEYDALVTSLNNQPIGIMTADCVPILLYAADIRMVAAVHAGWRGTVAKITEKTVAVLKEHGAKAVNIYAAFGPAICPLCYEVDAPVAEQFRETGLGEALANRAREGKYSLDLIHANKLQLENAGIAAANISESGYCTSHSILSDGRSLPSWRRDAGTDFRICSIIELTDY